MCPRLQGTNTKDGVGSGGGEWGCAQSHYHEWGVLGPCPRQAITHHLCLSFPKGGNSRSPGVNQVSWPLHMLFLPSAGKAKPDVPWRPVLSTFHTSVLVSLHHQMSTPVLCGKVLLNWKHPKRASLPQTHSLPTSASHSWVEPSSTAYQLCDPSISLALSEPQFPHLPNGNRNPVPRPPRC